jgi:hypothetical protein
MHPDDIHKRQHELGWNADNYARLNGPDPDLTFPQRAARFILAAMIGVLISLIVGTILTKAIANAAHIAVQGGGAW